MAIQFITVGTATPCVSQAFALEWAGPLVCDIPSLMSGGELRPQFSSTSGSGFSTLCRPDGSGLPFAVHSGAGPGIGVFTPPTPWGRFVFTGSVTVISTLTLYPTRG